MTEFLVTLLLILPPFAWFATFPLAEIFYNEFDIEFPWYSPLLVAVLTVVICFLLMFVT